MASMLGAKKKGRSMSFVVNDATNVRVFVRVRPFNSREKEAAEKPAVMLDGKFAFMIDIETGQPKEERYQFDECFWSNKDYPSSNPTVGQAEIYEAVGMSLLDNAFKGYHACLFAYGQTGAGKSYTMMGNRDDSSQWGMIPRLCGGLFERIASDAGGKEFKVEVGYIEIYNEKLKDLLGTSNTFTDVKIREHPIYGPSMEGNKLSLCKSLKDIQNVMNSGDHKRTIAATAMNSQSSRSHAVFSVLFSQRKVENKNGKQVEQTWFSKINLIDLAGSERVEDSGVTGDNFKEAVNINKSLTTLGRVMDALVELSQGKKGIIPPYRESMLTRMLQDSLGGNSKTMMFANVSPSVLNYEETLSTLRYSSRARNIVNNAKVNIESSGAQVDNSAMEKELEEQRRRAEEEARLAAEAAAAREREIAEQIRREQEAKIQEERERAAAIARKMEEEKQRADAEAREKAKIQSERDELSRDKDRVARELSQSKSQHEADNSKNSKEKEDLARTIAELRAQMAKNEEKARQDAAEAKSKADREAESLRAQLSDRDQQLSAEQQKVSQWSRDHADVSRQLAELQRSKDDLQRRLTDSENSNANLTNNVTELTGRNRAQAAELAEERRKNSDLEAENRILQSQVRKQTDTIADLEKRVAVERQKSNDYLMQLAEIETSVTRMGIRVPGSF